MNEHRPTSSQLVNAARGALAGAAGTWLMDLVTSGLFQQQPARVTEREEAARPNGKGSVENLVDRIEGALGTTLDETARSRLSQGIHYGLGVLPGAAYAVLRHRLPLLGAGHGLLYGSLLWALNDEALNTALGLAGPFDAYPTETHLRGLAGHLVLGVATDVGIEILGG